MIYLPKKEFTIFFFLDERKRNQLLRHNFRDDKLNSWSSGIVRPNYKHSNGFCLEQKVETTLK